MAITVKFCYTHTRILLHTYRILLAHVWLNTDTMRHIFIIIKIRCGFINFEMCRNIVFSIQNCTFFASSTAKIVYNFGYHNRDRAINTNAASGFKWHLQFKFVKKRYVLYTFIKYKFLDRILPKSILHVHMYIRIYTWTVFLELTFVVIAQYFADGLGISVSPAIIAHTSPVSIETHFQYSLIVSTPSQ